MCRSSATASTGGIPIPATRFTSSTCTSVSAPPTSTCARYIAPHTLKLGPDGLIYITCENSAVVAIIDPATNKVVGTIDSGSTNAHRLIISPDGQRLYTENEEDATISVIDLPARKLIGKIQTPHPLAGIAISADGRTIIAVDDAEPNLFLIDAASENIRTVPLQGLPKAAQIARYRDDFSLLAVRAVSSEMVSLIDPSFSAANRDPGRQPADGHGLPGRRAVRRLPGRRHGACDRHSVADLEEQLQGRNGLRIARIFLNLGAMAAKPVPLSKAKARRIWLRAQRLDEKAPFGAGAQATPAAVAHLGYVQIDTINVVERCHHQILYTRIPDYRREHLRQAQSVDRIRVRILDARALLRPDRRHPLLHARDEARGGAQWMVHGRDARRPPESAWSRQAQRGAHDPRHRRRQTAREGSRVGEPQAFQACAAARFLPRRAHGEPARGHAEDLRADNAAFRLGPLAEAGAGKRAHGLSHRPRLARAGRGEPRLDLSSRCAAQGGDPQADRPARAARRAGAGRPRRREA